MTPLHRAAHKGNSDVVKALIKAGSKVDEKDKASIIWKYEIELCTLHARMVTRTVTYACTLYCFYSTKTFIFPFSTNTSFQSKYN